MNRSTLIFTLSLLWGTIGLEGQQVLVPTNVPALGNLKSAADLNTTRLPNFTQAPALAPLLPQPIAPQAETSHPATVVLNTLSTSYQLLQSIGFYVTCSGIGYMLLAFALKKCGISSRLLNWSVKLNSSLLARVSLVLGADPLDAIECAISEGADAVIPLLLAFFPNSNHNIHSIDDLNRFMLLNRLRSWYFLAAAVNSKDNVQLLSHFIDGNNVNTVYDENNSSPLIYAVSVGNEQCINKLLACKANVLHQNNDGDTPLHFACSKLQENLSLFAQLLAERKDTRTCAATIEKFKRIINNLTKAGANWNEKNKVELKPGNCLNPVLMKSFTYYTTPDLTLLQLKGRPT